MRVALVVTDIPDYGIEFAEMAAESCDVTLFIPDRYVSPGHPQEHARLKINPMSLPRNRQALKSLVAVGGLAQSIRRVSPDVVHILGTGNVWMNLLCPLLGSIPVLTTVHDVERHPGDKQSERIPGFFHKLHIWQSSAILVHGEKLRKTATEKLQFNDKQVFTFPHVPLAYYKTIAKQRGFSKLKNSPCVLFFGRISEYKGLRYLVDAAPLVHAALPEAKFVVAGSGDDFTEYMAGELSHFEVYNRFIHFEEAARLFAEADVLVLPYIEASQSGVLMIAMAFGLPVIATDVGEISSTVESTGMGLIVPPRDKDSLASAVIKVLKDPMLRSRLSENAARAMATEYSYELLSARLLGIYETVMERGRRQSGRCHKNLKTHEARRHLQASLPTDE